MEVEFREIASKEWSINGFLNRSVTAAAKNTIPGDMPSLSLEETERIIRDHDTGEYCGEMAR